MPTVTNVLNNILRLTNSQYNSALRDSGNETDRFLRKVAQMEAAGKRQTRFITEKGQGQFDQLQGVAGTLGRIQQAEGLVGRAALGMATGLGLAVREAASLEQIEIGFRTVLGSAEAARAKIAELRQFSLQTPFNFRETARGAQSLVGMGVAANQVIPLMRALGNAVSAAGRGQDEFNRGVIALGQISTKNKVFAEELRQLQEAGVPTREVLERLGTTLDQVGNKGIDASRFFAVFTDVMNNGRFGGAMAAQSETLVGSLSNLQDAGEQLAASLGGPTAAALSFGAKQVTNLTNSVNALPEPVKGAAGVLAGVLTAGAIGAFGWLKLLEMQNIRLMNSALQAAVGINVQAGALNGLGIAGAGASGGRGLFGGMGAGLGALRGRLNLGAGVGLGAAAVGMGIGLLPNTGNAQADFSKRMLADVLTGGGLGASIGSMIAPGIGTAIGAAVGGVGGAIAAAVESSQEKTAEKPSSPESAQVAELKRINANLEKQLAIFKIGAPVDTRDVPGAVQIRALMQGL